MKGMEERKTASSAEKKVAVFGTANSNHDISI
jgi:hypothetical protein